MLLLLCMETRDRGYRDIVRLAADTHIDLGVRPSTLGLLGMS